MSIKGASVGVIWALALAGALVVALVTPGMEHYTWLPVVLGGAIVATFVVQLSLRRKEGFVGRLTGSMVGAFLIVAATTAVLALVR